MILLVAVVWVCTGLLSVLWWPTIHPSWSRVARIGLVVVGLFIACVGGPIGTWRMYTSARRERKALK